MLQAGHQRGTRTCVNWACLLLWLFGQRFGSGPWRSRGLGISPLPDVWACRLCSAFTHVSCLVREDGPCGGVQRGAPQQAPNSSRLVSCVHADCRGVCWGSRPFLFPVCVVDVSVDGLERDGGNDVYVKVG